MNRHGGGCFRGAVSVLASVWQGSKLRKQATEFHRSDLRENRTKNASEDRRFREFTGRDQWRTRFTRATAELFDERSDEIRRRIALAALSQLGKLPWADKHDVEFVQEIAMMRYEDVREADL